MSIGELHKHTCEAANAALSIVTLPSERLADAMKPRHFVEAFRRLDASLKAIKRLDVTDWPRTPGLTLARWAEPSALAVLLRFANAVNAEASIACQEACGRFRDAADCREWMDATCKALEGIAWDKAPRTDVARIATYLDDEHERATRAAEPATATATDDGPCYPASHYAKYTISDERLRKAAKRGRIYSEKRNSNRHYYRDADVRREWPQQFRNRD